MKLLPRILAEEDELDRGPDRTQEIAAPAEMVPRPPPWAWTATVAILAAVPRLAYLFFVSDPENAGHGFTDAYHHWQVAYLTREIGLSHGPRLWDLRGWEYYWGLLHPLLMDLLFLVTGSSDIVLARLLSLGFGVVTVVLLFLLAHRYWGSHVAVAAALFASVAPASIFNDVAGMAEPISVALMLFGIWLTPRRGFWAGVAWGLAATARVEAWLFGLGLVVAWMVGRRSNQARVALAVGWLAVIGLYMKFFSDQTGNPIYPVYWSFQFVVYGTFASTPVQPLPTEQLRLPLDLAVLACLVALAWCLWKRPRPYLLLVYGFGYSAHSFATFLSVDAWRERRFELPMDFWALLVAVVLLKVLPERFPAIRATSWAAAVAGLLAVQVFWIPIQTAYAATETGFRDQVRLGSAIGSVYSRQEYTGGGLSVPGDVPTLVYTMVSDGRVPGSRITSQFYDPFYYLPADYAYDDHKDVVGPLIQCWLSDNRTRLMLLGPPSAFDHSVPAYHAFMEDHPEWFIDTGAVLGDGLSLVAVQVPSPSHAECQQAARNAPH